jgi:phage terminase large subunit-like protein
MGKGNGKTPLIAGIGLYGLTMDNEFGAQIFSAACSEDQAKLLWTDAKHIVEASPELEAIVQVRETKGLCNLGYLEQKSFFRPFTKEQSRRSGTRPHMGLIDELHEHPSGDAVMKIRAGAKGRRQPLYVEITNSGYDRTSICWQHREHSRKVLERATVDDAWFAYVCALDTDDDPLADPSCWIKANPLLGVSIRADYLQRQVETAINIPAETNTVLRLNFCVWTQAISRFFNMVKWAACADDVRDDELDGATCYAGLDGGQTDDFTSLVGLFVLPDGRKATRCKFWLPEGALTKYPDRPYAEWQRAGLVTITEGDSVDYDQVERDVIEACRAWGVRELAYDKRFLQHMAQHLVGAGIDCTDQPQGFWLNEAMRAVLTWVTDGTFRHGAHLVLSWMAANMVAREGPNKLIRPDKDAAKEKIDGVVALIMAAARYIVAAGKAKKSTSVYASRGAYVVGRHGSLPRRPRQESGEVTA